MQIPLCPVNVVPEEGARRCMVPKLGAIAVIRHAGAVFALSDTCTHGLASLSEGEISAGRIYCPYHAGAFDLATGAAVEPPCTIPVRRYPVTVDDGQVVISVSDGNE